VRVVCVYAFFLFVVFFCVATFFLKFLVCVLLFFEKQRSKNEAAKGPKESQRGLCERDYEHKEAKICAFACGRYFWLSLSRSY